MRATGNRESGLTALGVSFRRPRVFIIDDEPAVLELLVDYLAREGYDLRTFTSAFDGQAAIAKHRPEVALVDLQLPGLHGLDLVGEAQKLSPATSFVVVTAHTTFDTLLEAIRRGVRDYLTKPFSSPDAVRLVVRNAVRQHGLEAQLLMQSTVTGSILRLGELSSVGDHREEFFALVRQIFQRLLECTTVVSLYRHKGQLVCRGDTRAPLTPAAELALVTMATEQMCGAESAEDAPPTLPPSASFSLRGAESTSPFVARFESLLPIAIPSLNGIEAQLVVADGCAEAFSESAVAMALSLANNVGIIVQRQILGADHEHRMIGDLLHNLKDGIVVLDEELRVRYASPQARRILQINDSAPLQEALESLSRLDRTLVSRGRTRRPGAVLQKQIAVRRDGEERFYDVEASVFKTPAGVGYRMIVFRDLTHLRAENAKIERLNARLNALNEELLERNRHLEAAIKELDSFAYIASHDLQEPFRHIEIFVKFLERDLGGRAGLPAEVAYQMEQIELNVDVACRLLADLRTLSRLTRVRNPYRESDFVELVEEVLERFASSIEDRHAQITVEPLPVASCDPIKLKEVFHNLISNALAYNDTSRPEIVIGGNQGVEQALFFVRDNGIGVASEHHEYIFEPCRRIPFAGANRGTGLGLAIVRKIIEEHGGRVWVESEPGQGATFFFTLPRHQSSPGGEKPDQQRDIEQRKRG